MTSITEQLFTERFVDDGRTHAPPRLGVRFGADGRFRQTPGNTVIRPVPAASRTQSVLQQVQAQLQAASHARHFTFLPPDSFHMTVFEGTIDERRQRDCWPAGLSYSAPIAATTDLFVERLQGFVSPGRFAMKVSGVTPLGLQLEGATPEDEATARAWRDALTVPFGYTDPNHAHYGFHITLAYLVEWLPAAAVPAYLGLLPRLLETVRAELPVLELDPPTLCSFDVLTRFEPVLVL